MAALALSLVACGTSAPDNEVTLWMYPVISDPAKNKEFWQKVEAGFEARHGVDLHVELQPWAGRQEKLSAALMSGSGPDVVLLQPDMIAQYVDQHALLPVNDELLGGERTFRPSAVAALTVQGKAYGVPMYQTITTTVYNRKLFAEAGITELPRTWDEIKASAPKLAARGVPVLDYSGSPEEPLNLTFYPLLWQAGGSVFNADGKRSAFSSPEGVAALKFLVDLKAMNGLPRDVATRRSDLKDYPVAAGRAAMAHAATAAEARNVIAAIGGENTAIGLPLQQKTRSTFGTPGALSLSRKAPSAAKQLLTYLSSPEVVDELCAQSGFFPPWSDPATPADEVNRSFTEALPFAFAGDTHPQARKTMSLLAPHLQAALLGEKTPEQALTDAAVEVDGMLGGN